MLRSLDVTMSASPKATTFTKIRETPFDDFKKSLVAKLTTGMNQTDKLLTEGMLMRVDTKHFNGNKTGIADNFTQIVKSM